MNTFMNGLTDNFNYARTENSALTHTSTKNAVYDMFALCAAYRTRPVEDCILMFKNAIEEDALLAMKCLFYIADCRGGQGERRFFRVCYKWLANNYPEIARKNLELIPEYRRWDDLIYAAMDTKVEKDMFKIVKHQLALDVTSMVSREGDLDFTKAITDLKMLDYTNQATLSQAGKMYSSTLLNYMR